MLGKINAVDLLAGDPDDLFNNGVNLSPAIGWSGKIAGRASNVTHRPTGGAHAAGAADRVW